ncbi:MAG: hypothetical protein ACOYJC_03825 [Christensenellales bacterium]
MVCFIILVATHVMDDIIKILKFNKKAVITASLLVLATKSWVLSIGEWQISIGGFVIPFFIFFYCFLQTKMKTILYTVFVSLIVSIGGYLLMSLLPYTQPDTFKTITVAFFCSVLCLIFGKGRISILAPSLICAQLTAMFSGLESMWTGMTRTIELGVHTNFDLAVLCALLTVILNYYYIKIFHQRIFIKRKQYRQWRS